MAAHLRFTVNVNNYNYYGATAPMNMLGEFDQKECPWKDKPHQELNLPPEKAK